MAENHDVSVVPQDHGRAPLQGGGEAKVQSGEKIGFQIEGSLITVFSIRLWVQYADTCALTLMESQGGKVVDVSHYWKVVK